MLFTLFFSLDTWQLGLIVFAVIGGGCAVGVLIGRYLRRHSDHYREGIGALQGALLGLVGLVLAFGLSLAVGRYQDRRADVVNDANTIGTAYLRAQTLGEPQRSRSLALLRRYNDLAIRVTHEVPGEARRFVQPPPNRKGFNRCSGGSGARRSTTVPATARRGSTSTA